MTMKAAGFFQLLILTGTLANAASAGNALLSARQGTAGHSRFATTNTPKSTLERTTRKTSHVGPTMNSSAGFGAIAIAGV